MCVATPVMIVWGVYATISALTSCRVEPLAAVPHAAARGTVRGRRRHGRSLDLGQRARFLPLREGRTESWWNIPTVVIAYLVGAFSFRSSAT